MPDSPASSLSARIAALLRDVPDFPSPGIVFKDIAPLLSDGAVFGECVRALAALVDPPIDLVAGVEARGFLLAGALAHELGCGVLPVRKAGKLPPPTSRRAYELEYGTAEIEIPDGLPAGKRVLLVDDVLATGGTLRAAAELLADTGAEVTALGVLVEIGFLGGRDALTGLPALTALVTV